MLRRRIDALVVLLVVLATLLLSQAGCGPGAEPWPEPRVGAEKEVRLAGKAGVEVRLPLSAGEYLHLRAHQVDVDVIAVLRDPTGKVVFEVDSPTGARGAEEIYWVAARTGDHVVALTPYEAPAEGTVRLEVVELRSATPSDRRLAEARAALARGDRRSDQGRTEEAVEAWSEALPLLEPGSPAEATTSWKRGEALAQVGELREAEAQLGAAVGLFAGLDDRLGQARAWTDLGSVRESLGHLDGAIDAHRRALALYRELQIPQGVATAQHNLAGARAAQGDVAAAVDGFRQALAVWQELGRPGAEAMTLQALGDLYTRLGRFQEARAFLERADERAAALDVDSQLDVRMGLAWLGFLEGDPGAALAELDRAVALARGSGGAVRLASLLGRRASVLQEMGRIDEARMGHLEALRLAESSGARRGAAHTRSNLGWLELEAGNAAEAREWLTDAARELESLGDPRGEIFARVGLGRLHRAAGRLETARGELERAVRLVEAARADIPGALSRSYFLDTRFDAFQELALVELEIAGALAGHGTGRRALEVVERSRARGLLDALRGEGHRQREEDRRRLLLEVNALEARRLQIAATGLRDPRLAELEEAIRLRLLEAERLEGTLPEVAASAHSLEVDGMQALLDDETLLVVYLLAEPESYAWTVGRRDVALHRLPGRSEIERRARTVLDRLGRVQEATSGLSLDLALESLARAVLDPLTERLEAAGRLAIVTDGALLAVPFSALPRLHGTSERRTLVEDFEVVGLPSATVLDWQRRALAGRSEAEGVVAVLSDPVFGSGDPRVRKGGSDPRQDPGAGSAALPADLARSMEDLDLLLLPRLPGTATEADAIERLAVPGGHWSAAGFEATKEAVTGGDLGRYRVLHFATHGLLHPDQPELSGLVMSLVHPDGSPRDGFLRAYEVADLDLPAELAVLSACQTGLGREFRGEGMVGLPQAFFQAGVRRVVVSRWKVNDPSTAAMMEHFYRGLWHEGLTPSAALRRAQLAVRAEERWSSPYYWAAFQVQGDWW